MKPGKENPAIITEPLRDPFRRKPERQPEPLKAPVPVPEPEKCATAQNLDRGLLGIPVSDVDARHLVATLIVEGTPDALTVAGQLTKGVERDSKKVFADGSG